MAKKFLITVQRSLVSNYIVHAESREEAIEHVMDQDGVVSIISAGEVKDGEAETG